MWMNLELGIIIIFIIIITIEKKKACPGGGANPFGRGWHITIRTGRGYGEVCLMLCKEPRTWNQNFEFEEFLLWCAG